MSDRYIIAEDSKVKATDGTGTIVILYNLQKYVPEIGCYQKVSKEEMFAVGIEGGPCNLQSAKAILARLYKGERMCSICHRPVYGATKCITCSDFENSYIYVLNKADKTYVKSIYEATSKELCRREDRDE